MPTTLTNTDLQARRVLDALRAAGFEVGPAARATRTVLDTFDGRLHAAGLRLEHHDRPESAIVLATAAGDPPARLVWPAAPRWPAELPNGPFRDRVAAVTEERALVPLLRMTSTSRTARRLDRRDKVAVSIELHEHIDIEDSPTAVDHGWVLDVHEVAGHAAAAELAITRLVGLGCVIVEGDVPTFAAGSVGRSIAGHDSSPTVPLDPQQDALNAFRQVLANLAHTIVLNLPGTADDIDPEFLHELRVAVRRTRSVLTEGKKVLPIDVRDQYRDSFRWLGGITGPPRDLDVQLMGWDDYVSPLDPAEVRALDVVRAELEARQAAAHRQLSTELRSKRATNLLDGWQRWLADPTVAAEDSRPIGRVVAERIGKAQAKVLRDGRSIDAESPGERLHDLRKDAKKLRYLLECFGTLFDPKGRKAFVNQLKDLQDNLGEHQDAEVHVAQLHDLAQDLHGRADVSSEVLLAMGRLADHLERRRLAERADFAARFAAYDSKANRRALTALLRDAART